MERTMSVEEKIKKAEEIYNRRKGYTEKIYDTSDNINLYKKIRLFKRMICQIIICLSIYSGYYFIVNHNYVFSEDFVKKSQEILVYDIDFSKIYNSIVSSINELQKNDNNVEEIEENKNDENNNIEDTKSQSSNIENNIQEENIGGANVLEEKVEESKNEEVSKKNDSNEDQEENQNTETTQMEEDAKNIKNTISFINPVEGTISSIFGWRNPTTSTVPKYHTGLDIATTLGTVIKSATDGTVSLASSEGDYRKSFKNNKWRCNYNICTL